MTIMRIKASIPEMGGSEGEMTFDTFKEAVNYVRDDMFYGPENPYMVLVKENKNDLTLMVTHGGMSFAISIKEADGTP